MALYKEVELENGIKLTYHRIRNINIETNVANWVEITSYIDKDARLKEIASYADNNGFQWNGYTGTSMVEMPYDQTMTVDSCYADLKRMEKFSGCKDC